MIADNYKNSNPSSEKFNREKVEPSQVSDTWVTCQRNVSGDRDLSLSHIDYCKFKVVNIETREEAVKLQNSLINKLFDHDSVVQKLDYQSIEGSKKMEVVVTTDTTTASTIKMVNYSKLSSQLLTQTGAEWAVLVELRGSYFTGYDSPCLRTWTVVNIITDIQYQYPVRCTRLDLAVDVANYNMLEYTQKVALQVLHDKRHDYERMNHDYPDEVEHYTLQKYKKCRVVQSETNTVYFGSRDSNNFIRIYDNRNTHGREGNRIELELKKDGARQALQGLQAIIEENKTLETEGILVKLDIGIRGCIYDNLPDIYLTQKVEEARQKRVKRDDSCSPCKWLEIKAEVLVTDSYTPIDTRQRRVRKSIERFTNYFRRNVVKSLTAIAEGIGVDNVLEMVRAEIDKCSSDNSLRPEHRVLTFQAVLDGVPLWVKQNGIWQEQLLTV
jgi:hypothetical protein